MNENVWRVRLSNKTEKSLGALPKSVPWRESMYFNEVRTGTCLAGARYRESMTQAELAESTGIPRRYISEMENGKRPIGKANARKLAEALNTDPRLLLSV